MGRRRHHGATRFRPRRRRRPRCQRQRNVNVNDRLQRPVRNAPVMEAADVDWTSPPWRTGRAGRRKCPGGGLFLVITARGSRARQPRLRRDDATGRMRPHRRFMWHHAPTTYGDIVPYPQQVFLQPVILFLLSQNHGHPGNTRVMQHRRFDLVNTLFQEGQWEWDETGYCYSSSMRTSSPYQESEAPCEKENSGSTRCHFDRSNGLAVHRGGCAAAATTAATAAACRKHFSRPKLRAPSGRSTHCNDDDDVKSDAAQNRKRLKWPWWKDDATGKSSRHAKRSIAHGCGSVRGVIALRTSMNTSLVRIVVGSVHTQVMASQRSRLR
jgi:hypothetical protein